MVLLTSATETAVLTGHQDTDYVSTTVSDQESEKKPDKAITRAFDSIEQNYVNKAELAPV